MIILGPIYDHILVLFAYGFLRVCAVEPIKAKCTFLVWGREKLSLVFIVFPSPNPSPGSKDSILLRVFLFPTFKPNPFLRRRKRTKSASKAMNLSQRTNILVEKPLALVTFTFCPADHLKQLLSFLVLNVIELYLLVCYLLFSFSFELHQTTL